MKNSLFSLIICFILMFIGSAQVFSQTKTVPALRDNNKEEAALLDSIALLLFGQKQITHTLSTRLGYTNKALFAGRNFGISQSLMIPSLTYLHKSGLYGELIGYSYSQSQPRYELTMASVGYMGTLGNKFLYLGEYSRSFYTKPDSNTGLANTFTLYGGYDIGKYTASVSYSHLFGNSSASNLLIPSISRTFTTKKYSS